MKSTFIAVIMMMGAAVFVSAWEGSASIAPGGDLPGGGYSIATNSFPVHAVVDVINLENGKKVRVTVISGLGSTGLMATLSRNAAEAIEVRGNSSCRIRMSQVSSDISLSRLSLGPIADPVAVAMLTNPPVPEDTPSPVNEDDSAIPDNDSNPAEVPVNQPANVVNNGVAEAPAENEPVRTEIPPAPPVTTAPPVTPAPRPSGGAYLEAVPPADSPAGILSFVPSNERVPQASNRPITPEFIIPSLGRAENVPPADFSPFQVPLITRLEQGKYYVQLAAYSRVDNVEDEINRIGKTYPLAVQNIGTDSKPLFRVLLGPLDQTESTALLQRFKDIGYRDAFVWHNR